MIHRYIDYANYNIWANDRLMADLLGQEESLLNQELEGSFPTIRATILHIWYAEAGWLSRLNGNGWEASAVTGFSGGTQELFVGWKATSEAFRDFVTEADLEEKTTFEHKGQQYSIPGREVAQTVFNHGSYHRGQVVMMMRQLGISAVSQTDYIEWVRENERNKLG